MAKIQLSSDVHAWRITLDDPPLHILDISMLEELRDVLRVVSNDRHALILDATGDRTFSAGASVQDHLGDRVTGMLERFHDCFRILARLDLVTIALVRGPALGEAASWPWPATSSSPPTAPDSASPRSSSASSARGRLPALAPARTA